MDETQRPGRVCELQRILAIDETWTPDCLYFEHGGERVTGCLFAASEISTMPKPIARHLLKVTGRQAG
jgi:hypothetical protein